MVRELEDAKVTLTLDTTQAQRQLEELGSSRQRRERDRDERREERERRRPSQAGGFGPVAFLSKTGLTRLIRGVSAVVIVKEIWPRIAAAIRGAAKDKGQVVKTAAEAIAAPFDAAGSVVEGALATAEIAGIGAQSLQAAFRLTEAQLQAGVTPSAANLEFLSNVFEVQTFEALLQRGIRRGVVRQGSEAAGEMLSDAAAEMIEKTITAMENSKDAKQKKQAQTPAATGGYDK